MLCVPCALCVAFFELLGLHDRVVNRHTNSSGLLEGIWHYNSIGKLMSTMEYVMTDFKQVKS